MANSKFFKDKELMIAFLVFIVGLLIYAIFSTRTGIHDTGEYITVTKELAGIGNVDVFSSHSVMYPLFAAQFVKVFPSLITIKLLSILWLLLDGLLIFWFTKNKSAFLLWIFSPLVWLVSIEISPILPVSFFMLLTYIFFKKWEESNSKTHFAISALSLGICCALYTPLILISLFFILTFMYDKTFKQVLFYLLLLSATFSLSLVIDQIIFGFAFNTLVRYIGVNVVMMLGLGANKVPSFQFSFLIMILLLISPLLFRLHRLEFSKNKKELLFLLLVTLFFVARTGVGRSMKYFIMFSPIAIVLLSKVITKKEMLVNCVLSILLIVIFTNSYFDTNAAVYSTIKDLERIKEDFSFKEVIAGGDQALFLASYSWTKEPRFIWWKDYQLSKEDKTDFSSYSFSTNPIIDQHEILELNVKLKRNSNRTFEDLPLIAPKDMKISKEFKLVKCYELLCVYEMI